MTSHNAAVDLDSDALTHADVIRYAEEHGWRPFDRPTERPVRVLTRADDAAADLFVPLHPGLSDYQALLALAVRTMAKAERRPIQAVQRELLGRPTGGLFGKDRRAREAPSPSRELLNVTGVLALGAVAYMCLTWSTHVLPPPPWILGVSRFLTELFVAVMTLVALVGTIRVVQEWARLSLRFRLAGSPPSEANDEAGQRRSWAQSETIEADTARVDVR